MSREKNKKARLRRKRRHILWESKQGAKAAPAAQPAKAEK